MSLSPNKHIQRAGVHEVLCRGRSSLAPWLALSARVPKGQRAGVDVSRWATLRPAKLWPSMVQA
jgi:hypothetical protein